MALIVRGDVPSARVKELEGFVAPHRITEQVFRDLDGAGIRIADILEMDVAVWDHRPDADELLAMRLSEGWRPTPSYVVGGPRVLGHAADVPPERWTKPGESRCR